MLGSVDTRRGKLSAVVRVRSPVTGSADSGRSSDADEPPELGVRRDGSRHVTVGVPECLGAPRQKETFEVTRVLPLDASPEEIFAGVGGPVVDWLWDGFNAVLLSYGQARAGKTTLLLGSDSPPRPSAAATGRQSPGISDDGHRKRNRWHKDDLGADGKESEAEGGERERGGGRGLLRDILREIFDNAAATAPSAPDVSAPTDAMDDDPARQNEQAGSSATGTVDVLNPLAGSWSPSRHACDGSGDSFDATEDTVEALFGNPAFCTAAASPLDPPDIEGRGSVGGGENGGTGATRLRNGVSGAGSSGRKSGDERGTKGPFRSASAGAGGGIDAVVALSAWELAGKNVTDLLATTASGNGSNSGSCSGSSNNRGLETTARSGKSGGAERSRSRNESPSSKSVEGDASRGGEGAAGGGGGNRRGRRRRSRGRSGSDDSTAGGGGGWPTGYPEGFLTVRAPSLAMALALVDTAQRNSRRRQTSGGTPGEPGVGKSGRGRGGGGKRGVVTAGAGAATPPGARGHVFFRVVVYNAREETVSTLHVVDLAGGWEPPSEKPAGKRGGKGSGAAKPSAVSREWNSFDAMMTGLLPPPPCPVAASTSQTSAASVGGEGAVGEEGCSSLSRAASVEPMPCSSCGASTGRARDIAESCCAAEVNEECAPSAAITAKASAPCGAVAAAEQPPPPLPPPHPVFGSPKGKTFGGGGGGKLVEALRPLMSGNTRTWLVVSVGGDGKGGPAAAWRALDVARRVAGVSTTCIRLRGVALADLGLRSSDEVLTGNDLPQETSPENKAADPAGGCSNLVVDRRNGLPDPASATSTGSTKDAITSALAGLGATADDGEAGLLPAVATGQSDKILGSFGGGAAPSFPSSPRSSSSGTAAHGESSLSLACTPLANGEGEGKGAGTTYVDNFLAGFARVSGGEEDNRGPRRISSGGALGADAVLSQHEEDVAAAWRAIGAEIDPGGGRDGHGITSSCKVGLAAATAALPCYDPRNAGEPQRQHPPLLQGSPLRPGGRATVFPPTRLPSKPSLPGAATKFVSGVECQDAPTGLPDGEDRQSSSEALNGTAVSAARRTAEGTAAVSPAVSKARGNIDRVMSSLLQDVLPARRTEESSGKAGPGAGGGITGERPRTSERSQTVADIDSARTRRSCSPLRRKSRSGSAATGPIALAGLSGCSNPVGDGAEDSNNSGFLTPIEVLMHVPAGGGHAGCPPCAAPRVRSQSLDVKTGPSRSIDAAVPMDGEAAHRRGKEPRQAAQSTAKPQAPGQGHSRASAPVPAAASGRVTNGRAAASFSKTNDKSSSCARGGGINTSACRRSHGASEATGQPVDGNIPPAAENKRRSSRNNIDSRNDTAIGSGGGGGGGGGGDGGDGGGWGGGRDGSERSSERVGEAGASGKIEAWAAGGADGCLGELEAEVGEGVALMRRNHATLLRVVREQEDRGKLMERRFEDKECDWLERVTSLEAELEGLRAEAVETRGRLRRAESSSPSAEVFERYEAHAGILEAENTSLRDRNIALELRLLELLRQSTAAVPRRAATPAAAAASAAATHRNENQQQNHQLSQEEDGMLGTTAAPFAGDNGATSSRFRVDGRVARPVPGASSSGGGEPMCAAVLKDLWRRLKEAELEAQAMRAERAAVDKRDRLCKAQLRALTKHRSKVRELFLREKEQEAKLTASRLESARAEAIADSKAAEVERLRQTQASLEADREALVLELADERRKSRLFDEDRRAYGHIRRFIERHAGGRPPEWDEDVPQGDNGDGNDIGNGKGLGSERLVGIERAEKERRYRRQHHVRRSDEAVGAGSSYTEDAGGGGVRGYAGGVRKQYLQEGGDADYTERPLPGASAATRRRGAGHVAAGTAGRALGAYDSSGWPSRWQHSCSAPRQKGGVASFAPDDDLACVPERSTDNLYSEAHRNSLDTRFGASRGLGGCSRGAGEGGQGGHGHRGDGSPSQDNDEHDDNRSHSALTFSAGRETRSAHYRPASDPPQRARSSSRITDARKIASDEDWTAAGGGDSGAPYYAGESFDSTTTTAWRVPGTDNTGMSPRLGWRGLGDEAEETEPDSEGRSSRLTRVPRGFGAGLGADEGTGGAMGATRRSSGSRLAGATAGSRTVSRANRSSTWGGLL
eukprot:g11716.t1